MLRLAVPALFVCVACGRVDPNPADARTIASDTPAAPDPETTPEATPEATPETGPDVPQPATETTPDPAPDPTCTQDGCLRTLTVIGDFPKATLEPLLAAGVHIDNGYTVVTVAFWSAGTENHATVTLPYDVAPPPGGFHIVANHHGTTGLDDACTITNTVAAAGLAGLFGARGMIGVAPEYPGLGTPGLHPYLVADSEARLAFDALRATRNLAALRGVPISGGYAMVGLSQGGHVTLAAAARHKALAPELDVRAFAVAGPATVWEEHWRAGLALDGPHLVYDALLVYAWADAYHYSGPSLWAPAVQPSIDTLMTTLCAWSPAGAAGLDTQLPTAADALFAPAFLSAFRSGDWGSYAAFHTAFIANRIGPYNQTAPLKIYQGEADTTVPAAATTEVVTALRAGGVVVDYERVPGAGHLDTAFGFVASLEARTEASLAWVRAQLDGAR